MSSSLSTRSDDPCYSAARHCGKRGSAADLASDRPSVPFLFALQVDIPQIRFRIGQSGVFFFFNSDLVGIGFGCFPNSISVHDRDC